jgi:polar amino acid transport system permease protein
MVEFTLWDIARNLLLAARWTVLLSLIAFVCGGLVGFALLAMRVSPLPWLRRAVSVYVELFQGTPLLMQLFLAFFGLPLLGVDVSPWTAAIVTLTLYTSAYLVDIWRGCVEAVPRGQWAAGASLGMTFGQQLRYIVWPQAKKIAVAPTVGFLVQVVKSTALTSIIGFTELTKTGTMITNAAFRPFPIYGMVALIYFAMCFPLTWYARALEKRQKVGQHRYAAETASGNRIRLRLPLARLLRLYCAACVDFLSFATSSALTAGAPLFQPARTNVNTSAICLSFSTGAYFGIGYGAGMP